MVNENRIRDLLATKLDLLEDGLRLVETEHKLQNPHGSKGSIDILARDPAGHFVIVELKRSNSSARSALHELFKYLALFRLEHGLPNHRLRCFLVSTHWHELLVPFSEFLAASDYQVEGFELRVSDEGTPLNAERVALPETREAVDIHLHHDILLFQHREDRDRAAPVVAEHLHESGARSVFVCSLDCRVAHIPHPYAVYAVVGDLNPAVRETIESELRQEYETNDLESISPTLVQEEFSRRVIDRAKFGMDTYEIGYPDKLTSILRTGWDCIGIVRQGRMSSTTIIGDRELLDLLQGLDGSNTTVYERVATPRLRASWMEFARAAKKSLLGNAVWTRAFDLFVRFVDAEVPKSQVAARIYNPLQVPLSISRLATREDASYLPMLEVVCSHADDQVIVLLGYLAWAGTSGPASVGELLDNIADSPFEYMARQHMGDVWEMDDELVRRLGLQYEAFVIRPKPESRSPTFALSDEAGRVVLSEYRPASATTLLGYVRVHSLLMEAISRELVPVSL